MKLLYRGKTKDVYKQDSGQIVLYFKDDVTGEDGVFDPGADTVGLSIPGAGRANLLMTRFFFEKLHHYNIPTHYMASDLKQQTMTIKQATMFGQGLEVICRYRAVGSFLRRYGAYCKKGEPLNALVEMTLKDDKRGDPVIAKDTLIALNILTSDEYEKIKRLTKKISNIVRDELNKKGLELYDIKLEFGRDQEGNIMLIDEISGGNMRVYKNGANISIKELETIFNRDVLASY